MKGERKREKETVEPVSLRHDAAGKTVSLLLGCRHPEEHGGQIQSAEDNMRESSR